MIKASTLRPGNMVMEVNPNANILPILRTVKFPHLDSGQVCVGLFHVPGYDHAPGFSGGKLVEVSIVPTIAQTVELNVPQETLFGIKMTREIFNTCLIPSRMGDIFGHIKIEFEDSSRQVNFFTQEKFITYCDTLHEFQNFIWGFSGQDIIFKEPLKLPL